MILVERAYKNIGKVASGVPEVKYAVQTIRKSAKRVCSGPLWPIQQHRLRRRKGMSLAKLAATVLQTGDVAFDVGANVGNTAWLMSSCVGKRGSVYAFEPNPTCFSALEQVKNSLWFPNLKVLPFALADRSASVVLHVDTRQGSVASTIMHEHAQRESMWHEAGYSQTAVTAITLDTFCETYEVTPTFLKLDVEGAEEKVIQGGREVIAFKKPIIWFECWGGVENGRSINRNLGHFEFLSNMNYIFFLATVFKLNGQWYTQNSKVNPTQLLPFDPHLLNKISAIGCDILAVPPYYLNRLKTNNLISVESAKAHLNHFIM